MSKTEQPTPSAHEDGADASKDEQPPKAPLRAKLWRWTKRAGLTLLGLFIAFGFFSQTQMFRDFLVERIERLIAPSLIGKIDLGELKGTIFTGISLSGVKVYDASGRLVAVVPKLEADYDLWALTERRFELTGLKLEGASVFIHYRADGTLNLMQVAAPTPPKPDEPETAPFTINLETIELISSHVVYVDERARAQAELVAWVDKTMPEHDKLGQGLMERIPLSAPKEATTPSAIAALDLGLKVNAEIITTGKVDATIASLKSDVIADTWADALALESDELKLKADATRVELNYKALKLGQSSGIEGLIADVSLEQDAQKAKTHPFTKATLTLDALKLAPALVRRLAPDIELKQPLLASLSSEGSPDALTLRVALDAQGAGKLSLDGTLTSLIPYALAEDKSAYTPSYELSLSAQALKARSLLGQLPDAALEVLTIKVQGEGVDPKTMTARASVSATQGRYELYKLDSLGLEAQLKDGKLTLTKPLEAKSPYLDAQLEGWAELAGRFDFKLATGRAPRHDQAPGLPEGVTAPAQADVALSLTGELDLEQEDPLAKVKSLALKGGWSFERFEMEQVRIGAHESRVDVELKSLSPTQRQLDYDVEMSGESIDTPQVKAVWFKLTSKGETRLDVPLKSPVGALARLWMNTAIDGRGIRAFGLSLNSIHTELRLDRPSLDRHPYRLSGELSGLRMRRPNQEPLTLKRASWDIAGDLELNLEATGQDILRWLSAQGSARVTDLDMPGTVRMEGALVKIDVEGVPPDGITGDVEAQVAQVYASGEEIAWAKLKAKLAQDREFSLTATVQRRKAPNHLEIKGSGRLDRGFQSGKLENIELKLPSGRTWTVEGTGFDARGGQIKIDDLELSDGQQRLSIKGSYRKRGKQDLEVKAKNVSINQVLTDAGLLSTMPPIKGEVETLDFSLKGDDREPVISLELSIRSFMFKNYGPFSLDVSLNYNRDYLTLKRFNLSGYDQKFVDAQARVPIKLTLKGAPTFLWDKSMIVSFRLHPLIFDRLAPQIPELEIAGIKGRIEAIGAFSGTLAQPTLDTLVRGSGLGIKTITGGQRISINGLSFESKLDYRPPSAGQGGLTARAWLDWEQSLPQDPSKDPSQGATRDLTQDPSAQASLLAQAVAPGNPKLMELSLETPMPIARWVSEFLIEGKTPDFRKDVLYQKFKTNMELRGLNLKRIDISPLLRDADAAGVINVKLSGQGTFIDPELHFDLNIGSMRPLSDGTQGMESIDGFGWSRYRDIIIAAKMDVEDGWFKLDRLTLNWDQTDIFAAQGKLPVPIDVLFNGASLGDLPLELNLEIKPVLFSKLQAFNYAFARVPGTIKGMLKLGGKASAPTLEGSLKLEDTQLGQGAAQDLLEITLDAKDDIVTAKIGAYRQKETLLQALAQARINLDLVSLSQGADPLKVSATSRKRTPKPITPDQETLRSEEELLIELKTKQKDFLDLREISPKFLTQKYIKRLKGQLKADVLVRGPFSGVKTQGEIVLKDGLVDLVTLGRTFEKIQMDLSLEQASYKLNKLALHEGETWVNVNGQIAHEGLKPSTMKLTARTKDFNVGDFVNKPFFMSTIVELAGRLDETPVLANITVKDLEVRLPKQISQSLHDTELDPDIIERNASKGDPLKQRRDKYSAEILDTLDQQQAAQAVVTVKIEDDAMVYHPIGQVRLGGDLQIQVFPLGSIITGQIETIEGKAEFLGREFLVNRGQVIFTGTTPPNPRLQLEAAHVLDRALTASIGQPVEGRNPKVVIRVTGTALEPRLRLRSDPEMSDTDILYVLATGRPPESADVGQDAGVVSAALSAASGLFLGMLQDRLEGKVPVQIKLDTGDEGLADSSIQIGRYITEDIFVSYRYRFGGGTSPSENIFEVEYHFAPRWMMEARYSDTNQGQFNVFWDAY